MSQNFESFTENLHQSLYPESICLITHMICSIALIYYLLKYRQKTPIIQNSPILTIVAQVMLLVSSLCLFTSKFLILDFIKIKQNAHRNFQYGCYGQTDDIALSLLSTFYTLSIQYMYISYLLKMIRVILIVVQSTPFSRFFINKLFNSEIRLIIISFGWSGTIAIIEILMKIFIHPQHKLHLYPQFSQFLCDVAYPSTAASIIFNAKKFLYLLMFLWSYWKSFALEEIDKSLQLKKQYFILISLPYFLWITQNFNIVLNKQFQNTALPVHYIDCLSNLVAGALLMQLHFNIDRRQDFTLPDGNDFHGENPDFSYILSNQQARETLRQFFQSCQRNDLFKINQKLHSQHYDHLQPNRQKIQQILQCLTNQQKNEMKKSHILDKEFQIAKNQVQKASKRLFREWKKTISGKTLIKKMQKNQKYYLRMRQLNLVANFAAPFMNSSVVSYQ